MSSTKIRSLLFFLSIILTVTIPNYSEAAGNTSTQMYQIDNVDLHEITMDITDDARAVKQPKIIDMRITVYEYMLKNGDITQVEIDNLKMQREKTKKELESLRKSGNEKALQNKIMQLRKKRKENREDLRAYVETHKNLSTIIEEQQNPLHERHEHMDHRREHISKRQKNMGFPHPPPSRPPPPPRRP